MRKITITVDDVVALRKESVDRNTPAASRRKATDMSLSARRAWIEIIDYIIDYVNDAVALRKESVDRNYIIKITRNRPAVALRKESVDRNYSYFTEVHKMDGRSPQGERG